LRLLGLVTASLVHVTGCTHATPTPSQGIAQGINPEWPYTGKAIVTEAPRAMVVSGSPIASEVGRDILQQGGNAIDAAVAVGMALAVVHPEAGNIGGGGFMTIRIGDSVYTIDYR
jgi:gamma-glutamyltranspeptidase/glutathione hydrolase